MDTQHVPASPSRCTSRERLLGSACAIAVVLGLLSVVALPLHDAFLRWDRHLVVPVVGRLRAVRGTDNSATATVTLRNLTARPIRVVGASTTCSCIAATNAFPVTLEPYSTISIKFELEVPNETKADDQLGSARFFTESESRVPQVEFVLGAG